MTVYDLPEEIPYDEEGHVDDHEIIHRGLKDHEDRIRGAEEGKSDNAHKHTATDITDTTGVGRSVMTASNQAAARSAIGAGTSSLEIGTSGTTAKAGNYHPTWNQVTGKPNTFTPSSHTHAMGDITDLDTELDKKVDNTDSRLTDTRTPKSHTHPWGEVTGKPSSYTPSTHTHPISQVSELQTSLNSIETDLESKANLVGGKIPTSEIPAVALTKPSSVANRTQLLALTAEEGDVGIITAGADQGTYMLGDGPSEQFASWLLLATSSDIPVQSVNGQVGTINLSYDDVGAAPTTHNHTMTQITGLETTLSSITSGKADIGHTHDGADITGELTDQVDVSDAMVDLTLHYQDEAFNEVMPLSDFLEGMYSTFASTDHQIITIIDGLDSKADNEHTHDGADITGALTEQVDVTDAVSEYVIWDQPELPLSGEAVPLSMALGMAIHAGGQIDYLSQLINGRLGQLIDLDYGTVIHTHDGADITGALTDQVDTSNSRVFMGGEPYTLAALIDILGTLANDAYVGLDNKVEAELVSEFPSNPTPGVLYLKAED